MNSLENTVLGRQDLSWCLRRTPVKLLKLLKASGRSMFVAGGFVRSCVAHEELNDIDVFSASEVIARLGADTLAAYEPGNRVFRTGNAFSVKLGGLQIQFIHRWTFQHPSDAIASFDFTIARGAFWFEDDEWRSTIHPNFYSDLAAKRLVYTSPIRNEDAGGSMLRVLKFYQRGYRIPLDSLGAVIARLTGGLDLHRLSNGSRLHEAQTTKVLTGLLRAVDPDIDPTHEAHLPSEEGDEVAPLEA